jgi:hypothetical protein
MSCGGMYEVCVDPPSDSPRAPLQRQDCLDGFKKTQEGIKRKPLGTSVFPFSQTEAKFDQRLVKRTFISIGRT